MANQTYCLRWESFQSNVTSMLDELRLGDELVDITLCCEGHRVGAHRVLLSACSSYFRDVLRNMPCQHIVFYLKDTSFDDLCALVEFIYKGSVNITHSQLAGFIKTAESLQIKGLSTASGSGQRSSTLHSSSSTSSHSSCPTTVPSTCLASAEVSAAFASVNTASYSNGAAVAVTGGNGSGGCGSTEERDSAPSAGARQCAPSPSHCHSPMASLLEPCIDIRCANTAITAASPAAASTARVCAPYRPSAKRRRYSGSLLTNRRADPDPAAGVRCTTTTTASTSNSSNHNIDMIDGPASSPLSCSLSTAALTSQSQLITTTVAAADAAAATTNSSTLPAGDCDQQPDATPAADDNAALCLKTTPAAAAASPPAASDTATGSCAVNSRDSVAETAAGDEGAAGDSCSGSPPTDGALCPADNSATNMAPQQQQHSSATTVGHCDASVTVAERADGKCETAGDEGATAAADEDDPDQDQDELDMSDTGLCVPVETSLGDDAHYSAECLHESDHSILGRGGGDVTCDIDGSGEAGDMTSADQSGHHHRHSHQRNQDYFTSPEYGGSVAPIDYVPGSSHVVSVLEDGTSQERFVCRLCGRSYTRQSSVKRHMEQHRGLTACPRCSHVSSCVTSLRLHLRRVHGLDGHQINQLVPRDCQRS